MKGKEIFNDIFKNSQSKTIGALLGLGIGGLIVALGLLKALFIVLCVILGYYIGKKKDKHEKIITFFQKKEFSRWK
jgi:uncharacterized membrane protein